MAASNTERQQATHQTNNSPRVYIYEHTQHLKQGT